MIPIILVRPRGPLTKLAACARCCAPLIRDSRQDSKTAHCVELEDTYRLLVQRKTMKSTSIILVSISFRPGTNDRNGFLTFLHVCSIWIDLIDLTAWHPGELQLLTIWDQTADFQGKLHKRGRDDNYVHHIPSKFWVVPDGRHVPNKVTSLFGLVVEVQYWWSTCCVSIVRTPQCPKKIKKSPKKLQFSVPKVILECCSRIVSIINAYCMCFRCIGECPQSCWLCA